MTIAMLTIPEDGAERPTNYLAHQVKKESTPQGRLRGWVVGVLSPAADEKIAVAELGSADPVLDASLGAHAIIGRLSDHLWLRERAARAEVDHLVAFCIGAVTRTIPEDRTDGSGR